MLFKAIQECAIVSLEKSKCICIDKYVKGYTRVHKVRSRVSINRKHEGEEKINELGLVYTILKKRTKKTEE